jgi:hypothetical protein
MRERLTGALAVAAVIALTSCLKSVEPLPLGVTIAADKPIAAAGDTIRFTVNAQGGYIVNTLIDYGDMTNDALQTDPSRTAETHFNHVYVAPGDYSVSATVDDAVAGRASTAMQVTIH